MKFDHSITRKRRVSTRDRFVSVLHGESFEEDRSPRWYRRREIFFPFLMILVFAALSFVVKILLQVQNQQQEPSLNPPAVSQPVSEPESGDEGDMTYEEAKKIFGNTGGS